MVLERFGFKRGGRARGELNAGERGILGRDMKACKIARQVYFNDLGGAVWKKWDINQKVTALSQLRAYILDLPSHLAGRDPAAIRINDALRAEDLLPEHALEGCDYEISYASGEGKIREVELKKFQPKPRRHGKPRPTSVPIPAPTGAGAAPPAAGGAPAGPHAGAGGAGAGGGGGAGGAAGGGGPAPPAGGGGGYNPPEPEPKERTPSIDGRVLHTAAAFYGRGEEIPDRLKQMRRGVAYATVKVWGPLEVQTSNVVESQYAGMTHTDEFGRYVFYNLPPGRYTGRAEKSGQEYFGPERLTTGRETLGYPPSGYLAQTKQFQIPRHQIRKKITNKETGEEYYEIIEAGHAHVDFEIEPIGETHFTATLGGKATRAERERFDSLNHSYSRFGAGWLNRRLRALRNASPGDSALQGIEAEFRHRINSGDPNAEEYLKKSLHDYEMGQLERQSGGRLQIGNIRRSPVSGNLGRLDLFRKSAYHSSSDYTAKIVKTSISIVIGLAVSAIIGSFWLFLGFLSLGISALLPQPKDLKSLANRIESETKHWQKQMASAISDEERKQFESLMNLELFRLQTWRALGPQVGSSVIGKEALKALGLMLISFGFMMSALDIAKPIGIVIAFIAYFSISFSREENIETPDTGDLREAWRRRRTSEW